MNPSAAKELTSKVRKLLETTKIKKGYIDEFDSELAMAISKLIAKEKKESINSDDVIKYLFDFIYQTINNEKQQTGQTAERLGDIGKTTTRFVETILELPIDIEVSFPLPKLPPLSFYEFPFTETDAIRSLPLFQSNLIPHHDFPYYVTTVKGFCGEDFDSPTLRESLTRLKVVLHSLVDTKVAQDGNIRMTSFFNVPPAPSLEAHITYTLGGEYYERTLELPPQINDFIYYLREYPKQTRYAPGDSPKDRLTKAESQLKSLFNAEESLTRRIFSAAEWHIDSMADNNTTMELLKLCIGLESIYGDDNSNGNLTESLADRCAYSLGTTHDERKTIKAEFREIYRIRSKLVHGVTNRLSPEDRDRIRSASSLLRRSIIKEVSLINNLSDS